MEKAKKNPAKFNIQFNTKNPEHRKVIEILTPKGRNTAEYIAEAILYYEKNTKADLRQTVTEIINEVLGETHKATPSLNVSESYQNEIDYDEISDALSGFKK